MRLRRRNWANKPFIVLALGIYLASLVFLAFEN